MVDWFLGFYSLVSIFLASFVLNVVITFFLKSNLGSQPLEYHYHLDTRPGKLFGIVIPNYFDVSMYGSLTCCEIEQPEMLSFLVTNGIFVFVGIIGLLECWLFFPSKTLLSEQEKQGWYIFFFGFFCVSFGSAYYHWRPNNWTLVWDRLPITIAFMSMYFLAQKTILPESQINLSGNILLGTISIVIWYLSLHLNKGHVNKIHMNYLGNNDGSKLTRVAARVNIKNAKILLQDQLLPYYVIQFYPIAALLYMLCIWPKDAELRKICVVPGLFLYILAKILETLDLVSDHFYKITMKGIISGHSLKHLAAGLAVISFMIYIVFANSYLSTLLLYDE